MRIVLYVLLHLLSLSLSGSAFLVLRAAQGCTLHITRKSGDDKNIMMLAARSGDPMTLKMVAEACKSACPPQEVFNRPDPTCCVEQ